MIKCDFLPFQFNGVAQTPVPGVRRRCRDAGSHQHAPGRNDVMSISLYCESCRYQWTMEDTDESDHPAESKPEK